MRTVLSAMALLALMLLPACTCTHPDTGVSIESYVEALEKVKDNLGTIRTGYAEAMDRGEPYVPELREARLGFVDATSTLCEDALVGDGTPETEAAAESPVEPAVEPEPAPADGGGQ